MLVVCAGRSRSGSTLMYNIVRITLSHAFGKEKVYARPIKFYKRKEELDYNIVKLHDSEDDYYYNSADFVFSTNRDENQQRKSIINFRRVMKNQDLNKEQLDSFIKFDYSRFKKWSGHKNFVKTFDFDMLVNNKRGIIYSLCSIFNITVNVDLVISEIDALRPPKKKQILDPVTALSWSHKTTIVDKFVFVHIPKTGGGTFRRLIDGLFPNRTIRDSEKPYKNIYTEMVNVKYYDIIHGHFLIDKYKNLNRPKITFLRDPVERLISEYFFFYKAKGHINESGNLSLVDYAKIRKNIQFDYVKDLNLFEFVGITEFFNVSLDKFEKFSGVKVPRNFTNYNVNKDKRVVSKEDRKLIRSLNSKDYEIYNTVLKGYI